MEKLSACIKDLYLPCDIASHIREGEEYWYGFGRSEGIMQDISENDFIRYRVKYPKRAKSLVTWAKVRITYKRSGIVFYDLPDFPKIKEGYFIEDSYMYSRLIPCKINMNELREYYEGLGYNSEEYFSDIKWDDNDGSIEIESI